MPTASINASETSAPDRPTTTHTRFLSWPNRAQPSHPRTCIIRSDHSLWWYIQVRLGSPYIHWMPWRSARNRSMGDPQQWDDTVGAHEELDLVAVLAVPLPIETRHNLTKRAISNAIFDWEAKRRWLRLQLCPARHSTRRKRQANTIFPRSAGRLGLSQGGRNLLSRITTLAASVALWLGPSGGKLGSSAAVDGMLAEAIDSTFGASGGRLGSKE